MKQLTAISGLQFEANLRLRQLKFTYCINAPGND